MRQSNRYVQCLLLAGCLVFANQNAGLSLDLPSVVSTANSESDCTVSNPVCASCCPEPWIAFREPLSDRAYLDRLTDLGARIDNGDNFKMPLTGGAWHWFHQSLIGRPGGYGIPAIPNTYFWYLYADPQYKTAAGRTIGGHMELRLRETRPLRSFINAQVWTWELYGYIEDENLGKLKAGQLFNRFGLFWDGSFFGNAAYFDGLKLDADYGLSWEKTTEIHDCLKLESYLQFFFHEDQANGSFAGADAESIAGYTERNTGVFRLAPTWTRADGSQIAAGASAYVGQIDSQIAFPDQTIWAYGLDLTYTKGPWKVFAEGSNLHGVRNPVNYVSGGPSDELTNFLTGIQYTRGAVTYRCHYSNSIYENPHAVQNMLLTGATVALTKHVDLYLEWNNQRIDGADIASQNGPIFNALEWVINWHF